MKSNVKHKRPKYSLEPNGEFVIGNYLLGKPLASFFPGIAGKYGIPMWIFYVNRGQAIAGFGSKDKDHAIMEFFPANKSWQFVSLSGFRTFLKVGPAAKQVFYEPFHNGIANKAYTLANRMKITAFDLKLEEENRTLGLEVGVEYFMIPNDVYAGLARIVTIRNTSRRTQHMQVLDGLPQIVPYGTSNLFLKKLGRTIEAWMKVKNLERSVPYYKLDVDPTDRPEVTHIREGNFYLGFHYKGEKASIIKPVVDPEAIFGQVSDFSYPDTFLAQKHFGYPRHQLTKNKMPCGFSLLDVTLAPQETKTLYCVIGFIRGQDALNTAVARIANRAYFSDKQQESKSIIEGLTRDIETNSDVRAFDLYARQTYLDNILRGGYPTVFATERSTTTFYLYSRKHGDLERDYNKFQIQPTYYSQGNGNYRDVNQNRRSDIWFNPDIGDENIRTFFNLLQTDGYNPLIVKGVSFSLRGYSGLDGCLALLLKVKDDCARLAQFLIKPFTPGDLILFIEENGIQLKVSYDAFIAKLLSFATPIHEAEHGEGFWTDHWAYNLDLLESYLALYPEQLTDLIFKKTSFTFFDNGETVKPRCEKYVLKDQSVRQLHAIYADNAKKEMIRRRAENPHVVRAEFGRGPIYRTTLINKLLCLAANKLATLDPSGVGIEMEADKPNWFDALNGLSGLLGSSLCETLELKRLCLFLLETLKGSGIETIPVTEEVHGFLAALHQLLKDSLDDFTYWDKSAQVKEEYRHTTRLGVSGKETPLAIDELALMLDAAIKKLDAGITRAYDKKADVYYAYFINEAVEFEVLKQPFVRPTKFAQKKLPFFLEAQMHALRIAPDKQTAKTLYAGTKRSPLYDKKLKMYKVTAPLASMPEEIGRCRVFTPGWLENESIWLHMEYKYLLELLKSGLYEEFYADFKHALIPFQDPKTYGRSILENSSFLVSSAFPDERLHGNGFVARLSGSTAEFLNMWLIMNLGPQPFTFIDGALRLRLAPILPGWLFRKNDKTYRFRLFSAIPVTYHNPKRKNTFGSGGVSINRIVFKDAAGKPVEISGDTIPAPYAGHIRSRQITAIDAFLQ